MQDERWVPRHADLYRDLWMRDLFYSESTLLKLGYQETVRAHFETFLNYQLTSGQVPTVISPSGWRRLVSQRFHFWTADTEILFVSGMIVYAKETGDYTFLQENRKRIDRCVEFIRRRVNSLGLLPGSDWRDAIVNYYGRDRKFLLSNQVLLAQMYDDLEMTQDAKTLKDTIRELFFLRPFEAGSQYPADCISWDHENVKKPGRERVIKFECRLDSLGASLAILGDIIAGNLAVEVARHIDLHAKTKYGYRNLTPPVQIDRFRAFSSTNTMNGFVRNGAFLRNRQNHYQNSALWPFVEARIVSAFRKVGLSGRAAELSKLMIERDGYNEWYSPMNGRPKGSRDQLWTAAAVLGVND
jgi:glycogen debranching enzyme